MRTLKLCTDINSSIYVNEKHIQDIQANSWTNIFLPEGTCKIEYVNSDNCQDFISEFLDEYITEETLERSIYLLPTSGFYYRIYSGSKDCLYLEKLNKDLVIFTIEDINGYKNGVYDKYGKKILPIEYSYVRKTDDGLIVFQFFGKYTSEKYAGFINQNNNVIFESFSDIFVFNYEKHNYTICIKKNGFYTFIDEYGVYKLQSKYSFVSQLKNGYAQIKGTGGYGLINEKLEEVLIPQYASVDIFKNGWAKIQYYINDSHYDKYRRNAIVNIDGYEIILSDYSFIGDTFHEGMLKVFHPTKGIGFINEKGEEIIRCKYHSAEDFCNGYAKVRYDTEFGYINKKGELRIDMNETSLYISNKYGWGWFFYKDLIKVQIDNKFALIRTNGEEIVSCIYDDILLDDKKNIRAKKNNHWGTLNIYGYFLLDYDNTTVLINKKYDWVYPFKNGFAVIEYQGRYGYINIKGEELVLFPMGVKIKNFSCNHALIFFHSIFFYINTRGNIVIKAIEENFEKTPYEEAYSFKCNLARVKCRGKYGFINTMGKQMIPFIYDYAYDFDEDSGLSKVGRRITTNNIQKDLYGIIDKNCNIIIPLKFDELINLSDNLYIYKKNDLYGIIDANGICITNPEYQTIKKNSNNILIAVNKFEKCGVIDYTGKTIISFDYTWISVNGNYFILSNRRNDRYYEHSIMDLNGNIIIPMLNISISCIIDKHAIIKDNNNGNYDIVDLTLLRSFHFKYIISDLEINKLILNAKTLDKEIYIDEKLKIGLIDKDKKKITPCLFEDISKMTNEVFAVKKDNKWGLIDIYGKGITSYLFESILGFKEGLIAVKKDNKWGYIDINGKEVIPFKYSKAKSFSEGLALVDEKSFINKHGELVISLDFHYYNIGDFNKGEAVADYHICVPGKDDTYCTITKGCRKETEIFNNIKSSNKNSWEINT